MTVFAVPYTYATWLPQIITFTLHYLGDSEADYVMFFRSSRNSSEMDFGDNEDSGNDDNADTPRPSMTDVMALQAQDKAKVTIACNFV